MSPGLKPNQTRTNKEYIKHLTQILKVNQKRLAKLQRNLNDEKKKNEKALKIVRSMK